MKQVLYATFGCVGWGMCTGFPKSFPVTSVLA